MEGTTIAALVGIAGTVTGMVLGYAGYSRIGKKDIKQEGQENGELKADIKYIKGRTDDMLLEQRSINQTLTAHATQLAKVEEIAKSAHKRIDALEEKS